MYSLPCSKRLMIWLNDDDLPFGGKQYLFEESSIKKKFHEKNTAAYRFQEEMSTTFRLVQADKCIANIYIKTMQK